MNPRVVVFGAKGQLGQATLALLGKESVGLDLDVADFTRPETLEPLLDRLHSEGGVRSVINCAAFTAVDRTEEMEATALLVNSDSPGALARWCASRRVPLVHYSTDYVFTGEGTRPWREEDPTGPLNAYGRTKLAGEKAVAAAGGDFLTFRTSWVFDSGNQNFVGAMLRLGAERESLRVVCDQFGAPTYAPHLARASVAALAHASSQPVFPSGIYHLCNSGETHWHAFATEIFAQARALGFPLKVRSLDPIPSSAYPTPARRPHNSRLDTRRAAEVLGVRMPSWQEGLRECMHLRKEKLP